MGRIPISSATIKGLARVICAMVPVLMSPSVLGADPATRAPQGDRRLLLCTQSPPSEQRDFLEKLLVAKEERIRDKTLYSLKIRERLANVKTQSDAAQTRNILSAQALHSARIESQLEADKVRVFEIRSVLKCVSKGGSGAISAHKSEIQARRSTAVRNLKRYFAELDALITEPVMRAQFDRLVSRVQEDMAAR